MTRTGTIPAAIGILVFVTVFTLGDTMNWPSPRYFPIEHAWHFVSRAEPGRVAMGLYGLILYALLAGGAASFAAWRLWPSDEPLSEARGRAFSLLALAAFTACGLFFIIRLSLRTVHPTLFP